jgi:5-hydroxyisourate hydrolase-like protein (transthyretin family)
MHTRLRRPAGALITLTLAAGALGLAPAAYAADGTISGVVTGSGGALESVEVALYQYNSTDSYWEAIDYTDTDATGRYSIVATAGGAYRVGFTDYYNGHVEEFFDDAADIDDADTINVTSGGNAVASADLAPGAHVTGTVTGPGGGDLQGIRVVAYRKQVDEDGYVHYPSVSSAYTDVDGTYDIASLAAGSYRLAFSDAYDGDVHTYANEYYENQSTVETAKDVSVAAAGTVSGIDAELALDAAVSGKVTDAAGAGIEDAWIQALVKVGSDWNFAGSAWSGTDGTYVLDGLAAGTYRLRFAASVDRQQVDEYWNDRGRLENATDVPLVAGGQTAGINAQLVPGEHDAEITVQNTVKPAISGTTVVGSTLTASTGSWSPTPTEYYYDWLRDGEFIVGSYDSTYTLTAADLGKSITVLVTAGADDWEYGHAESAAVGPVTNPVVAPPTPTPTPTPTPAPTVDVPTALTALVASLDVAGKPKVGKTLKLKGLDKLLRATGVSYKFQWLAGSKKIKKATKSKLKVTKAMKGKKISVKVTAKAASSSKTVKIKVGMVR